MGIPTDPLSQGAPIWELTTADVVCPMCEYNLRGLTEPRCPECGYTFDWRDLTDETRKRHPWLFEHHPRRNLWSFFRTLIGGLWPIRFWRSISPAMPSRPGRLVLHWALSMLLAAATLLLGLAVLRTLQWMRTSAWEQWNSEQWAEISGYAWWYARRTVFWKGALVLTAWPVFLLATLMLFRQSMRRAKMQGHHVLRCMLYSFDSLWLIGASVLLFALAWWFFDSKWHHWLDCFLDCAVYGVWAYVSIRIYLGYRIYMKFEHPFWTVVAAQAVTALVVLITSRSFFGEPTLWGM